MIEVEQKFIVPDPSQLISKLKSLGFGGDTPAPQTDLYFQHPVRDFADTDEAFRLRQDGAGWAVTYKGPRQAGSCKQRLELELPIQPVTETETQWSTLLSKLGFRPVKAVRKIRQHWRRTDLPNGLVTIDRLQVAQTTMDFCEIEFVVVTDADSAAGEVEKLANQLLLDKVERRSYLEILLEADTGDHFA